MNNLNKNLIQTPHLWFGQWINDTELEHNLNEPLTQHISCILSAGFPQHALVESCQRLAHDIETKGFSYQALLEVVQNYYEPVQADELVTALIPLLQPSYLNHKLRCELNTTSPDHLQRQYPHAHFETWAPLGCLVHVMPSNVFILAALGLIEGLLSQNINIVKLSTKDSFFASIFAQLLIQHDNSQQLKHYIAVLRLSSKSQTQLKQLFQQSDVISAWGGENAIQAIRELAPSHVKLVNWGHKVSFGYLAASQLNQKDSIQAFAKDICRLDQQACSSPQTLLVEANPEQLLKIGHQLASALAQQSPLYPAEIPDLHASAEISTVMNLAYAEQALGLCQVIESEQHDWRIIVDYRPGLKTSPLYRTIRLSAICRDEIVQLLRPMKAWLQTCGLAANRQETIEISRQIFAAGVSRITRFGEMIDSYNGAPHDGVYPLQQFMKRISLTANETFRFVGDFSEFESNKINDLTTLSNLKIIQKKDFQLLLQQHKHTHFGVTVRSGGSSGQVAYSPFLWEDYDLQMHYAAHALVSAGLAPDQDRVMNLFAGGYMYGSFISYWTILEKLQVQQFPMTLLPDYQLIVDEIIRHRVDTLIGMTPHLLALCHAEKKRLLEYGGIKKIFYGGESLSNAQLDFLQAECGIELVKSVIYGSNDAGPMGYQCIHSDGNVHHLISTLQRLEILKLDSDEPVNTGEIGRLIFSSRARTIPKIERYEIGDMGRWIDAPCPCGRTDPRFELMGRLGDSFKAGTPILNYANFVKILSEQSQYHGPFQIHLSNQGTRTHIEFWMDANANGKQSDIIENLFSHYHEFNAIRTSNLPATVHIKICQPNEFVCIPASGKLKHICDHRYNKT